MKFILFFFRFVFKLAIFCFVFGALGMALMQFYGKSPSNLLVELKEAAFSPSSLNHGPSIQNIDINDDASREFIITIKNGTKEIEVDTRLVSNIQSVNQKDLRFSFCYDNDCYSDGELYVKRVSLRAVNELLAYKGISCYYPLKKDLINLKYFDRLNGYATPYGYKYEAVLLNEQEINIPKDRKTDFERALSQCDR